MVSDHLTALVDDAIGKPWHRRRAPILADLFDHRDPKGRARQFSITLTVLVVFYVWWIGLDFFFIPDVGVLSIVVRLAVAPLVCGLALARIRRGITVPQMQIDTAICVLLSTAAWCFLLLSSDLHNGVIVYLDVAPLFLIVNNVFCSLPFGIAAGSSFCLVAVMSATVARIGGLDMAFFAGHVANLAWTAVLTLIVNWRSENATFAVFVRTLKSDLQQRLIEDRNTELLRLSTTDALTGLANRRTIDRALPAYCEDRLLSGRAFAVLLVDVDFFKRFNDTYGHQEGDRCLIAVGQAMTNAIAAHDSLIGRVGGEEFVTLVRCETATDAWSIAEELRRSVETLSLAHDARPDDIRFVTISVGLAFSEDLALITPDGLIGQADQALYAAKAAGRNCVRDALPNGFAAPALMAQAQPRAA